MERIILLIDLDYFYAQAEEVRRPELKGKPVAVCMFSGRTEFSGAVATANYPARALGVKAGMPISLAKSKAPEIVLLRADREYYSAVSDRVMEVLRLHADRFEQVSIDEAYVDVSERTQGDFGEAERIVGEIKGKVLAEEKLTCSVGIGPNKLIAKMAAGIKKPDGLTIVRPEEVKKFLSAQKISDLFGVGPKTVEALEQNGIATIEQLSGAPIERLKEWFGGNKGIVLHNKSLGIDDSGVEEREQQQFSRIVTLKENTSSPEKIVEEAGKLAAELAERAAKEKVGFRTVSIILISSHLEDVTRSRTLPAATQDEEKIVGTAAELFRNFFSERPDFVARRFGLRVSGFEGAERQKSIFEY